MNTKITLKSTGSLIAFLSLMATSSQALAALSVVPKSALTAPAIDASSIVDFEDIASGMSLNGLSSKGFAFSESGANAIVSDSFGGPGDTNNISSQKALSLGDMTNYVLTIDMPGVVTAFGFGFAILDVVPTTNALTVTLFDGATNLGSLTYEGSPDPTFNGGFVGIGSTIGFTSAEITFGPTAAAYAMDNIAATTLPSAVPEGGSFWMGLTPFVLCVAGGLARRKSRRG